MRERSIRIETLTPFDFRAAEEHLAAMAAKGWRLERTGRLFWTYRRTEPARIHYSVTSPPAAGEDGEIGDRLFFQDLCAAAGWEKVADWAEMQIYANATSAPTPLETDPGLFLERIHRSMKITYLKYQWGQVVTLFILLMSMLTTLVMGPRYFFLSNITMGLALSSLLLILLYAARAAGYYLWRRRSLRSVEEDGELAPIPTCTRVLDRLFWLWYLLAFSIPFVLEAALAGPSKTLAWLLGMVLYLHLAFGGFCLLHDGFLARREFPRETQIAVTLLCVLALILPFGRRARSPEEISKMFLTPEPEEGEYLWDGQVWDQEPLPLPLTAEDLTGEPWAHVRRSIYRESRTLLASETVFSEAAAQEDGRDLYLNCTILDVGPDWTYRVLLNSLLDVGETIPYRAEDPAPWGAEAAYQRFRDGEPTGDWLVCWPGRILDLYLEAPDLEEAQIARAAARLAPENGEEEAP